jgi:hypothetical protein
MTKNLTPRDGIKVVGRAKQPNENQIAKAFVDYVRTKYPKMAPLLIHIPNEGKRSPIEGARQKACGLRKGVFDYFFAMRGNRRLHKEIMKGMQVVGHTYIDIVWLGLWLELKSEKGKPTKEQLDFQEDMYQQGYQAIIVNGLDEAIEAFEDYIKIPEPLNQGPNIDDIPDIAEH